MKRIIIVFVLIIAAFLSTVSSIAAITKKINEETDIRQFKNQIVVELWKNGPIIPAKRIWFTSNEIIIEPQYSSTSYQVFTYEDQPRIFLTDMKGNPSLVYVSVEGGYVIVGEEFIPIPTKLE